LGLQLFSTIKPPRPNRDEASPYTTVKNWFKQFVRLKAVAVTENIDAVRGLTMQDRHVI